MTTAGSAPQPRAVAEAFAGAIDGHRWDDLAALLGDDFRCVLVHTGEEFTKDGWVRFNAEYPGFQRFIVQDVVSEHDRAALRAHVTGLDAEGVLQHFDVASFLTIRAGLVVELTEVWADADSDPPPGTRTD